MNEDLSFFRKHPYRMKRLRPYYERMSKDHLGEIFDDNVGAALKAQGFSISDSPRSVYRVDKLYDALARFSPVNYPRLVVDPNVQFGTYMDQGMALAKACFRSHLDYKLQPLPMTPETVIKVTSNPSGSAGLTMYGCTKAEAQVRALERGLQVLKGLKKPEPCLAFYRTQFNDKTRLVWGYPYDMTLIEGLIAWPLLQHLKGGRTPMAFAMTSGALGTKLRVSSYHKEWAYSIDLSAFDSSISSTLIWRAFRIIESWFDPDEVEPVSGCKVSQIIKLIRDYFIHTPIVMPDGNVYLGKRHGVPSGSFFTQIVDSIVNVMIAGTLGARFKLNIDKNDIYVLGDDLLIWSNRKVDLDRLAEFANHWFGVKMHGAEKSAVFHFDEAVHYLGRDWNNGLPNLETSEILKRMAWPERFRKYPQDPVKKQRAIHLLILSYAATYWNAWGIAQKLLGSDLWYAQQSERIDGNVYGKCDDDQNLDHLSGLMRYQRKYGHLRERTKLTTTATQYWL